MPPFVVIALGALGAAALAKLIASETHRINEALERRRKAEAGDLKTVSLERDPATGEYRPRS